MSPHAEGDVGLCARGDTRVTNTRSRRGGAGLRKDGGNVLSWDGGGGEGEGGRGHRCGIGHADTRTRGHAVGMLPPRCATPQGWH